VDQSSTRTLPRGPIIDTGRATWQLLIGTRGATCPFDRSRQMRWTNQKLPRVSYNRRRLYLNGVAIRYFRMVVDRRKVPREVPRGPIIDRYRYRYHHRYGHRYRYGNGKRYRYGIKKSNGNAP